MNDYRISDDIALVRELLHCSNQDLASGIGISVMTLKRWESGSSNPNSTTLASFYDYAFRRGLRLNVIKAQLQKELLEKDGKIVLFHGSKNGIEGPLELGKSKASNDFGPGFYCGETLEQSAMFVAGYPAPSIYLLGFDPSGLDRQRYSVNQDWMLTIAWFRGKLADYAGNKRIRALVRRVQTADYLIAPIADNRMFEIIDTFIDGEITDVQCQHCLSATNLGMQYVLVSQKALGNLEIRERCFLSPAEKENYLASRVQEAGIGADKVKVARRTFRGQGHYVDEILS